MIVLEKWDPKKPISVIYWEGEKELFYVKRFLIENPDKEEKVISDHSKSYLETVFTDYRPVVELVFAKKRGKERQENTELKLEDFISIKGITALGNQLTKYKLIEINPNEPLHYEPAEETPLEELEVIDEINVTVSDKKDQDTSISKEDSSSDVPKDNPIDPEIDDEGQTLLF